MDETVTEQAVAFQCAGDTLIGVIAHPRRACRAGVLIVVGGPQYRAGSHRQFVLLARHLAEHSIASMRFDYRGMGDSDGQVRTFAEVKEDIGAAIDTFLQHRPTLQSVLLWGLCDAASAALLYAPSDARVGGLIMLNPWVRTLESESKTYLRHYYVHRLLDPALWRKLLSGRFDYASSLKSFVNVARGLGAAADPKTAADVSHSRTHAPTRSESLPDQMAAAMARFEGRILLILSGSDLTAKEFEDLTHASATWRGLMSAPRVTRYTLPEANHTFSRRVWRNQVAGWTAEWTLACTPMQSGSKTIAAVSVDETTRRIAAVLLSLAGLCCIE